MREHILSDYTTPDFTVAMGAEQKQSSLLATKSGINGLVEI
jgi:hypothetical protein